MIKVLDSFIADKIAAGEVIERPVSIVKELIENSIDAGAESIICEIREGGKSYIRVTDDGCGIPSSEVQTAFLRHATSKISSVKDLDGIVSLGFRGEALASIAAVSRLNIITRTAEDSVGTSLILHGGQMIAEDRIGTNKGTTIVVEDIFYNTPARRKFMGTDAREATAIIELVEHYAICYDNIRFRLINNGKTLFTTDGDSNKLHAITTIYPTKEYSNLIPVETGSVQGYISNPGVTKSSKRGQLFFVNGRLVDSPVIEKGIERGYGDRIFSGYPIAILFIDINPKDVDVNVHPGKREIKFLNRDAIVSMVAKAVDSVMNTTQSVPEHIFNNYSPNRHTPIQEIVAPVDIKEYLSSLDRNIQQPQQFVKEQDDLIQYDEKPLSIEKNSRVAETPQKFNFQGLEFKGYIFNSYIIMQLENFVFFIDQHAAHERIFYERLTDCYNKKIKIPQPILTPFVINVSADVYAADREWMNTLRDFGYDIDDFGANTFIIKGIPKYMEISEAESFAVSFIDNSGEFLNNKSVIDKLIMKSCKAAVKANECLSEKEIMKLVDELSKCSNPFSCPHGRPTLVKVTKDEIEKSFKRK